MGATAHDEADADARSGASTEKENEEERGPQERRPTRRRLPPSDLPDTGAVEHGSL